MKLFRRSRGQQSEVHRLVAASDLHGSTRCLRKLLHAAERYEAASVLVAGDLVGKFVVPVINKGDQYVSHFGGDRQEINRDELDNHLGVIEDAGLYPYITSDEELNELQNSKSGVDAIFHRLACLRVEKWAGIIDDWASKCETSLFIIPGNDDFPEIDDFLKHSRYFHMVDGSIAELASRHELLSLGLSNITPWHAPRDVSEEVYRDRLQALASQLSDPRRAVFMIHCPPVDTRIDLGPKLDEQFRPSAWGEMVHVGSRAVREVLEEYQPILSVHGHIHESAGVDSIGRTICINPGSEYSQGILRGVMVNVGEHNVVSHMFFSG